MVTMTFSSHCGWQVLAFCSVVDLLMMIHICFAGTFFSPMITGNENIKVYSEFTK